MALLQQSISVLGKSLPKVISPKAHAIVDYTTAAVFFGGAARFWRRSKRAALASLICGAAEAGVAALTDYPGGLKPAISFALRRKIGFGLSSMTAAMPEFLAFEDERERAFFRLQSVVIAGVTVLTDYETQRGTGERERRAA